MSESTPIPDGHKKCGSCGEVKPATAFYVERRSGRLINPCRVCSKARNRKRYAENPEVRAKQQACNARWDARNPEHRAEYYQQNREKFIAAAVENAKRNPPDPERRRRNYRAWYAANRDRIQATKRAWRESNADIVAEGNRRRMARRRARLRGLPTETYTVDQLIDRDGTACVLCGEEIDFDAAYPAPGFPTVEHLECMNWPDSAGDVLSNVALSHFRCNCQRHDRPHPAAARKRAELLAAEQELTA